MTARHIVFLGGGLALMTTACVQDAPLPAEPEPSGADAAPDGRAPPIDAETAPDDPPNPDADVGRAPDEGLAPVPDPLAAQCPPDGWMWGAMGAELKGPVVDRRIDPVDLTIVATAEGPPPEGVFPRIIEPGTGLRFGSRVFDVWFEGQDAEGGSWWVALSSPVPIAFAEGEVLTLSARQHGSGWDAFGGSLRLTDAAGLRAFVTSSDEGFDDLDVGQGMTLARGERTCRFEEEDKYLCVLEGFDLEVHRGQEVTVMTHHEIAPMGPFDVVHAGLMSIIDRGACNAGPQRFNIGIIRR